MNLSRLDDTLMEDSCDFKTIPGYSRRNKEEFS